MEPLLRLWAAGMWAAARAAGAARAALQWPSALAATASAAVSLPPSARCACHHLPAGTTCRFSAQHREYKYLIAVEEEGRQQPAEQTAPAAAQAAAAAVEAARADGGAPAAARGGAEQQPPPSQQQQQQQQAERRAGGLAPRLDLEAMRAAAAHFVGEHDFRNFCKVGCLAGPCASRASALLARRTGGRGAVSHVPLLQRSQGWVKGRVRLAAAPLAGDSQCTGGRQARPVRWHPMRCTQVDVAQVQNFRRRILEFRIERLRGCAWGGRALLRLHIRGTAFLWHQARGAGGRREAAGGCCGRCAGPADCPPCAAAVAPTPLTCTAARPNLPTPAHPSSRYAAWRRCC